MGEKKNEKKNGRRAREKTELKKTYRGVRDECQCAPSYTDDSGRYRRATYKVPAAVTPALVVVFVSVRTVWAGKTRRGARGGSVGESGGEASCPINPARRCCTTAAAAPRKQYVYRGGKRRGDGIDPPLVYRLPRSAPTIPLLLYRGVILSLLLRGRGGGCYSAAAAPACRIYAFGLEYFHECDTMVFNPEWPPSLFDATPAENFNAVCFPEIDTTVSSASRRPDIAGLSFPLKNVLIPINVI